jgi:serine/threonine-protein kinase HipA
MAIDAGIMMNECRIYNSEGDQHFMTKRFDRENGKKLHMQSLGAMAHISYQEPGACGYELAAMYMKELGISYNPTNKWLRAHQMTVNGKTTEIGLSDLLEAGNKMGIKEKTCEYIDSIIAANII